MKKNEEFKMKVKTANYFFSGRRDLTKCLQFLKEAGSMVLKEMREEKEEMEEHNYKLALEDEEF